MQTLGGLSGTQRARERGKEGGLVQPETPMPPLPFCPEAIDVGMEQKEDRIEDGEIERAQVATPARLIVSAGMRVKLHPLAKQPIRGIDQDRIELGSQRRLAVRGIPRATVDGPECVVERIRVREIDGAIRRTRTHELIVKDAWSWGIEPPVGQGDAGIDLAKLAFELENERPMPREKTSEGMTLINERILVARTCQYVNVLQDLVSPDCGA